MTIPLPLTPFEQYMLVDSHLAYPMAFTFRLHLDGLIDTDRLRLAAKFAAERHPLLKRRATRVGSGWPAWTTQSHAAVSVQTVPYDPKVAFPTAAMRPPTEEPGLRLCVMQHTDGERSTVAAQFHHVCTDGTGAIQFLSDLLLAYHYGPKDCVPYLPKLDPDSLPRRNRRKLTWRDWLRNLAVFPFSLEGSRKFFFRSPRPLGDTSWPKLNVGPPEAYREVHVRHVEANELAGVQSFARAQSVTTYEVMMAILFQAARDFIARHGDADSRWIRMNVPVNLRRPEHNETPAANIVSMVFLDRKPRHMRNERRLIQSIHGEMSRIKRFDVKYTFLYFATLLRVLPGAYYFLSRSRKCYSTLVFSNLGKVLEELPLPVIEDRTSVAGIRLVDIDMSVPCRPLCSLAFSLVNYRGRTTLTLHSDPRGVSSDRAIELLDDFIARLRSISTRENRDGNT